VVRVRGKEFVERILGRGEIERATVAALGSNNRVVR
jgi:hypothetical protein